ncbi:lysostaphin resistance A-like protein [Fructilactobacillus sp. Tb1]|uniref:CPBP family intramembrane glutamic endopeptidase n=1 Tax=Fructilactobacillus sp. Tb1 TaxID=3422304 RepID=UPI003D2AECB4
MKILKVFFNYILVALVISIPAAIPAMFKNNTIAFYTATIVTICISFSYVYFENKNYKFGLFYLEGFKNKKIILYGMIILLVNQFIFIVLSANGIVAERSRSDLYAEFSGNAFLLYTYFIVIGPIVEEVFFRGIFYKILLSKQEMLNAQNNIFNRKTMFTILVNMILFSFLHKPEGLAWIFFLVGPFVLSISYLKTDNLKVPICLHIFNNLVAALL